MSKIPYVIRRGDTLYFRIRVPTNLRPIIQRNEIVQSLKTQSRQEAIPAALELAGKAKTIFNNLSKDMSKKDLYDRLLHGSIEAEHNEQLKQATEESKKEPKQTSLPLLLKEYKLKRKISDLQDRLFEEELARRGDMIKASNDVANMAIKVALLSTSSEPAQSEVAEVKTKPSKTPKLSTALDEYCSNPDYLRLKGRTKLKYETAFKVLRELMGSLPIGEIDHFEMNGFFNNVAKLPPKRAGDKFKDMSCKQIIATNDGIGLSLDGFNGYKSPVSMFITWAKDKYRGAFDGVNMRDIKYKGGRTKPEGGQRSFKHEELETLFNCNEMNTYCKSGKLVYRFWLPAIGLLTGMRVNEICQLNPFTDIVKDADIWYFWVTEETDSASDIVKSVKSGTSRIVPMHSKLIELGLLDYLEALKKAGHKRMFPHDKPRGDAAGGNTSRSFRRLIDDIGLKDETVNKRIVGMHAFRKTIITHAYRGDFISEILPIVGHEDDVRDENGKLIPGVTKRYIDKEALEIPLSVKKQTIEKVKFDILFTRPVRPVFE